MAVGNPKLPPRGGFSAIELAIVVLVMGILAAAAAPRFTESLSRTRVEAARKRILADLRYAQRHARTTGASRTVTFDVAADSYTISGVTGLDRPYVTYATNLARSPYSVDIVSATFEGSNAVSFSAFGVPSSAGSIVLQCGSAQVTVRIPTP